MWDSSRGDVEGELFIIHVAGPASRVLERASEPIFFPEQVIAPTEPSAPSRAASVDFLLNREQLALDPTELEHLDAGRQVSDRRFAFGRHFGEELRLLIG